RMTVGNCTRSSDTRSPPVAGRAQVDAVPPGRPAHHAGPLTVVRISTKRSECVVLCLSYDAGREGNCVHLSLTGDVLVLLGLVAAGSGVASATLWRASVHVQAEAFAAGATTLLVTEPGVLELVDDTVTVRASAPAGSTVVLAVGREADVRAWVGLDRKSTRLNSSH